MLTSFIRAIPGWLSYHILQFFASLRRSTVQPPKSEFTHLIRPIPVKHIGNGKPHEPRVR
jgi:hypothetical protein